MTTITATHTVDIERPTSEVFDFVADQANEPKWHTDVLEVNPATPLSPGGSVTWLVKFMGKNTYVCDVTAYEPPQRIVLTTREGPLKPVLTHSFESHNGGTRYTRQVQIPLEGSFRLVGPIMRFTGAANRRNSRFAQNLRTLIEGTKRP
jgi:uncharacterized protein YndB with AHSA1/START domain